MHKGLCNEGLDGFVQIAIQVNLSSDLKFSETLGGDRTLACRTMWCLLSAFPDVSSKLTHVAFIPGSQKLVNATKKTCAFLQYWCAFIIFADYISVTNCTKNHQLLTLNLKCKILRAFVIKHIYDKQSKIFNGDFCTILIVIVSFIDITDD